MESETIHNILTIPTELAGRQFGFNQKQQLLMCLRIYEQSIIKIDFDKNGPVSRYEVSPQGVVSALSGLSEADGLFLPPQTVAAVNETGGHGEWRIAIYIPPHRRKLFVGRQKVRVVEIPLPPLVFVGRPLLKYCIYALSDLAWPVPQTPVFRAPFPNIYHDRVGLICRGDAPFPRSRPETIHQALEVFFVSHFNRDLDSRASRKHPSSVLSVWDELADAEAAEYPLDDLVPLEKTLQEVFNDQ